LIRRRSSGNGISALLIAASSVSAAPVSIVFLEGVRFTISNVAFAAKHFKIEVKNVVQFAMPVIDETGGNHHQSSLEFSSTNKLTQYERSLNRLA
jgi:hypothetical protein